MTVALKTPHMMPFNDIISLIQNIAELNTAHSITHNNRTLEITDTPASLGIFDVLSHHICVLQNRYPPMILKPEIAIFVSNQAVENILNPEIIATIKKNMDLLENGKHIINQACNIVGCGLKTYDLNITIPTEDIRNEAAMTEVEATQIMAYSMESVRDTIYWLSLNWGVTRKRQLILL
jgi:nicotinate-nucleotide--dimethylbenzimidazole phosphoribosyltransferase